MEIFVYITYLSALVRLAVETPSDALYLPASIHILQYFFASGQQLLVLLRCSDCLRALQRL